MQPLTSTEASADGDGKHRAGLPKALGLLRDGLGPACEDTWRGFYGDGWLQKVNSRLHSPEPDPSTGDVAFLFKGMKATWNEVFGHGFPAAVRSLVFEVSDVRNRWAHQKQLSTDDTVRALDSMERVLEAFGNSDQRDEIRSLRRDLMRQMFDEESRSERRRTAAKPTEGTPESGLTPWRDIIAPHADVAAGRFEQAEYAADLDLVAAGGAEPEYQDPQEFFTRTYITQGLHDLLAGAARRLSGGGGDPVIELQTNFGGGKTHSMIALYHLASGIDPKKLPGVGDVLAAEGIELPANVNRAVLVGQMISPSAPLRVPGGMRLHTLWGRLAYQLGGKDGYDIVRADDLAGTSPGAALKTLFERYGPAVVLIDEWVAYARQLRDGSVGGGAGHADGDGDSGAGGRGGRLAGGDFDTQFTFAQALTEAAAAVPDVVVLISIPASDVEVGGPRGKTALEKLKNVVARKAAQWQPASPDESFEIVRRRLFDPIPADRARVRDGVIRAFCDMYRTQGDQFPPGVGEGEYRRRMELCYPIHPELFDRLFDDWSALDKFQRTRGVLRLMALAISQLWQRDDRSLLIMPGNLPMDYGLLVSEMKKYLEDGWDPVIKSDVDGANSLPLRIDRDNSHFGRLSAARRAARTVYMGSAPRPDGRRGVDEKSIVLGCTQPGESPRQFADALKRLSGEATHLYVDGRQYWYSLIPNVTRLAADRANSNYKDIDADDEVRRRIDAQRDRGSFAAVQVFAEGPGDVPDNDDGVRLVVLEPDATHSPNDANSPAVALASQDPRPARRRAPAQPQPGGVRGRGRQPPRRTAGRGPAVPGVEVDRGRPGVHEPHAPPAAPGREQTPGDLQAGRQPHRRDLHPDPHPVAEPGHVRNRLADHQSDRGGGPRQPGQPEARQRGEAHRHLQRRAHPHGPRSPRPVVRARRRSGAQAVGDLRPVPPHAQTRQPRRALRRHRQQSLDHHLATGHLRLRRGPRRRPLGGPAHRRRSPTGPQRPADPPRPDSRGARNRASESRRGNPTDVRLTVLPTRTVRLPRP